MTPTEIQNFVVFFRGTDLSYNEDGKKRFTKDSKKYLKELVKRMNLPEDTFDIRFNAGGIAVSGEATLHADHVYFQMSAGLVPGQAGYFRSCASRKDYTGNRNNWVSWDGLKDIDSLAKKLNQSISDYLKYEMKS